MNINNRALLIGASVAGVMQIVIIIINTFVGNSIDFTTALDSSGAFDTDAFLSDGGWIIILLCCCVLFTDMIGGGVYAFIHAQSGGVEIQDGLIGGAASGIIARIVSQVLSICLSFFALSTAGINDLGLDPAAVGAVAGFGIIGALFGLCFWVVIGAVLGGIGGASVAAVRGNE